MYASNEAWDADREKFESMLPEIGEFKGHLADGGETLLSAIRKIEEINQIVGNLYVYAGLSSFEDLRVGENSARFSEAQTLYSKFGEETAFFSPGFIWGQSKNSSDPVFPSHGLAFDRAGGKFRIGP